MRNCNNWNIGANMRTRAISIREAGRTHPKLSQSTKN
jgi:hypothetical protein